MDYCSLRRSTDPHRPRRGAPGSEPSDAAAGEESPDAAAGPKRRATYDVPPRNDAEAVPYHHSASTIPVVGGRLSERQAYSAGRENHLSFRRDESDFGGSFSSDGADVGDVAGRGVERMESLILTDPMAERDLAYGNLMNLMKIREGKDDGSASAGGGSGGGSADCSDFIAKASKVCPPVRICRDNDDELSSSSCSGSSSVDSSNITETSPLTERRRKRREIYFKRCARGMAVLVALAAVSGTVRYLVEDGGYEAMLQSLASGLRRTSQGSLESKVLRGFVGDDYDELGENVREQRRQARADERHQRRVAGAVSTQRHRRTMAEDGFNFQDEGQYLRENFLAYEHQPEYNREYFPQDNMGYPA